jgi:lysozyme family protein
MSGTDPFPTILAFTLSQEGGLVDNPDDPGGLTNLGLTLSDMRRWLGHKATGDDVRGLTPDTAAPIYRAFYWAPISGPRLPPALALMVFDSGVNRGIGTSAKMLQRIVGATPDGIIGPLTLTAVTTKVYGGMAAVLSALHDAQTVDYQALNDPEFETGWLNRCAARYAAAVGIG